MRVKVKAAIGTRRTVRRRRGHSLLQFDHVDFIHKSSVISCCFWLSELVNFPGSDRGIHNGRENSKHLSIHLLYILRASINTQHLRLGIPRGDSVTKRPPLDAEIYYHDELNKSSLPHQVTLTIQNWMANIT